MLENATDQGSPAPENWLLNIHQHTTNYSSAPPSVNSPSLTATQILIPKVLSSILHAFKSVSESMSQGMQPKTTEKSN